MWQVILGAAIAGSTGFVAKRFFNPFSRDSSLEHDLVSPPIGIGFLDSPGDKTNGVFRFSSTGSTVNAGSGSGSSPGFKKSSGVKRRVRVRGLMKKKKNGEDQSGKVGAFRTRSDVCLKKPRTLGDTSATKRGSCYNNQDHSTFSSSLGVFMMYMMSAEKSEISNLRAATEETVKVIKELKDELSRVKSLQGYKSPEEFSGKPGQIDANRSEMVVSRESLDIKSNNGGEYASSVLTEEPEQETVEMEQLEMELESELQKLNLAETSTVMEECKDMVKGSESYQCGGISATELDKKLSHLLIEQQEGQINDLESELQTTQSKLQQKEAELQALKVCVRRLTEFPLLDRSDDEHEQDLNQDLSVSWSQHNQTDKEERKTIIGTKRSMESSIHV